MAVMADDLKGARRVLVTGLSTYWGGRLAAALETNPEIEAIIATGTCPQLEELRKERLQSRSQSI